MLIALDIETSCNVPNCIDKECKHALIPYKNKIDLIGIYDGTNYKYFTNVNEFHKWCPNTVRFIGHNIKFDAKMLYFNETDIRDLIIDDTSLMAVANPYKIPEDWLEQYEQRRLELNKQGGKHRRAKWHSLKTLAPYWLKIKPFWEVADHNNVEYNRLDCEYTYKLYFKLKEELEKNGVYQFYKERLLPWTLSLLDIELQGIKIDMPLLTSMEESYTKKAKELMLSLDGQWAGAYEKRKEVQIEEIHAKYREMRQKAIDKLEEDYTPEKESKISARYHDLEQKAIEKTDLSLNLDSPAQLKWLFKDYFKLDIEGKDEEDSTGKLVLERLAAAGRKDVETFIDYRKTTKILTSFFPTYKDYNTNGYLYSSFRPEGTRTGRLSSSDPNLQQVAGDLHQLFTCEEDEILHIYDMSYIEPRLIAYYSNDPVLYDVINKKQDFHGLNTKIFFGLDEPIEKIKELYPHERKVGKTVGLALMYGAGPWRLKETAMQYGYDWHIDQCKERYEDFKETYRDVFAFRDRLNKKLEAGEWVPNILKRPIKIHAKKDVYMTGLNTLIQSSASDLVLNSAHLIQKRIKDNKLNGTVVSLVHDEIISRSKQQDSDKIDAFIRRAMTEYNLVNKLGPIPLEVEGKMARRWEK